MSSSTVNLESSLIPLQELILATDNFSVNAYLGDGEYGVVYKGQLSTCWQNKIVAIKRINENSNQKDEDFRNELQMITCFDHENIIPFIGYCDEANEMIMVYDLAVNGSLDFHLQDPNKMCSITWAQRLKICLGVARGLKYLHSGLDDNKIVIHRNVKSANILLNDNMEGLICGFDVSVLGFKDQPNAYVYTSVSGTQFYLDPVYHESGILNTKVDVYSLGIILFEMLSGMLVSKERSIGDDKPGNLINLVRRYHDELDKLIDPNISDQINNRSLATFKEIAYKCLAFDLEKRPTMDMIVEKIEEALEFQANHVF